MPGHSQIEAASVALIWNGRILMVRRGREPSRGLLALPGGRIRPGESAEAAARRELAEETGLRAGQLHHLHSLDIGDPAGSFRLHVYRGEVDGGVPVAGDDAEHAAWYRLEELDGRAVTGSSLEIARQLLSREPAG